MSATTNPAPITTAAGAINASSGVSSLRANLETATRNGANDVPDVVQAVAPFYPGLQAFLDGQSALGSKTVWAPIATYAVTWAVGAWGLNWDAAFTNEVAGLVAVALMLACRWVASGPITSLLPKKAAATPGAK